MAFRCKKCFKPAPWACYECGMALCDAHIKKIPETEITNRIYCLGCYVKFLRKRN